MSTTFFIYSRLYSRLNPPLSLFRRHFFYNWLHTHFLRRQLSDFIQKAAPNLFFENCFLILSVLCQLFPVPPSKVPTEYPCPDPHNRPYNVPHRSDQAPSACRTAFFRPVSDRRDFPGSTQQARPHSTPDAACGYVRT